MTQKSFAAKEIIFREGDPGDAAYIIESGNVEILKHAAHGEVQLAILPAGTLFGEMSLLSESDTRSATARALDECTTLDVMSREDVQTMLAQSPERLRILIDNVFRRLREVNERLAAKERATIILDSNIEHITIAPGSDVTQCDTKEMHVANLPFTVGGYKVGEQPPHRNDMEIPCDGPPLMISQQHIKIERQQDGVFVVDTGSRFCTSVNSKQIGRGKVSNKAPLQPGENTVTLGDHTSPYKLLITCK